MDCITPPPVNPVERFVACFGTVKEAALAAQVSTEMLRKMRLQGYVSTRDRAITMAVACQNRVPAAELLAVAAGQAA